MNKNSNMRKKTLLVVILLVALGALSVVYAALAGTLTINGGSESTPGVTINNQVAFDKGLEAKPISYGNLGKNNQVSTDPNGTVSFSSPVGQSNQYFTSATITGTALTSTNQSEVYKLPVYNLGSQSAKLTSTGVTTAITDTDNNQVTDSPIVLKIYKDCTCLEELSGTNTISINSSCKVDLFVKVSYNPSGDVTSSTNYNYTITTNWETVQSA